MNHRIRTSALLLLGALTLAACGSDDDPTAPVPQVIEETTFHPDLEVDLSAMTETQSGLYYEDIVVGTGATAEAGDSVFVAYAGFLSDGRQFDAGEFPFLLASGGVIPGFDEGVTGMAVGGARKIVIPPELGYGSSGSGPIPPGAILVFDVQLRDVTKGPF